MPGSAGTETPQSVDRPDRYAGVSPDGAVSLMPAAAATSFQRVQRANGISLRLAASPSLYLRHDRGRLTTGASTTFHRS